MNRLLSITSFGIVLAAAACSSNNTPSSTGGTGGGGAVGGGTSGSAGKPAGTGGTGTGGTGTGGTGTGGTGTGGTGTGGTGTGGTGTGGLGSGGTGMPAAGGAAPAAGGTGAIAGSAGAPPATGGSSGMGTGGGTASGGMSGTAGAAGGTTAPNLPPLVTSASGAYWQTVSTLTESTATATVTVNDTATAQTWQGFGAAFNEIGWNVLSTTDMQTQAIKLLFSATDGANFAWGRIPIGASDYAISRYTDDDTGTDVAPMTNGSNRPAADTAALAKFSITRDGQKLIPYIKAAQAVKPELKFWASPWTPPVWMKTGYKTNSGADSTQPATKPSYYDGGSMTSDAATLTAYALYYTQWVQGYVAQGINIAMVSPQNEPGYDQNYPSCLWDSATYVTWVGKYLGPAMQKLGVSVMLGTLSNAGDNGLSDINIATAVLGDATAKGFVTVAGVQWGVLDQVNSGTTFQSLPIWATEHKCGNYPWCKAAGTGCPAAYDGTKAPNDQAYGVESWGYIRDAITKGKVVSYSAWNMVLDASGLGIDTTRDWKQDALLVADSGTVTPTAAYYVFRHFSQYVQPNAVVVGTTGGDAVAFKNPDGSIVAVMFNSGAANSSYVVAIGGKKYQFSMPSNGWATIKYSP